MVEFRVETKSTSSCSVNPIELDQRMRQLQFHRLEFDRGWDERGGEDRVVWSVYMRSSLFSFSPFGLVPFVEFSSFLLCPVV